MLTHSSNLKFYVPMLVQCFIKLVGLIIGTITWTLLLHQCGGVLSAMPSSRHTGNTLPRTRVITAITLFSPWCFFSKVFKVEELLAPCTLLNISSIFICITRTVFLVPGLYFYLHCCRTPVFSCTPSVWSGITHSRLPVKQLKSVKQFKIDFVLILQK